MTQKYEMIYEIKDDLQSSKAVNHWTIVSFEANKQINNAQDQTDNIESDCSNIRI